MTDFPKINREKYIKHLESENMALRQTHQLYQLQNEQLKKENRMLTDHLITLKEQEWKPND